MRFVLQKGILDVVTSKDDDGKIIREYFGKDVQCVRSLMWVYVCMDDALFVEMMAMKISCHLNVTVKFYGLDMRHMGSEIS